MQCGRGLSEEKKKKDEGEEKKTEKKNGMTRRSAGASLGLINVNNLNVPTCTLVAYVYIPFNNKGLLIIRFNNNKFINKAHLLTQTRKKKKL